MFSHFRILLISIFSTFAFSLSPGDIAFTAYNGDGSDDCGGHHWNSCGTCLSEPGKIPQTSSSNGG